MTAQLWSTVVGGVLVFVTTLFAATLQRYRERERLDREDARERERLDREDARDRDRVQRDRFEQRRAEKLKLATDFNEAARTMESWARRDENAKL